MILECLAVYFFCYKTVCGGFSVSRPSNVCRLCRVLCSENEIFSQLPTIALNECRTVYISISIYANFGFCYSSRARSHAFCQLTIGNPKCQIKIFYKSASNLRPFQAENRFCGACIDEHLPNNSPTLSIIDINKTIYLPLLFLFSFVLCLFQHAESQSKCTKTIWSLKTYINIHGSTRSGWKRNKSFEWQKTYSRAQVCMFVCAVCLAKRKINNRLNSTEKWQSPSRRIHIHFALSLFHSLISAATRLHFV